MSKPSFPFIVSGEDKVEHIASFLEGDRLCARKLLFLHNSNKCRSEFPGICDCRHSGLRWQTDAVAYQCCRRRWQGQRCWTACSKAVSPLSSDQTNRGDTDSGLN